MNLTFQDLANVSPPGSIEFIGNNQLKINLTQLTGDNNLNFDSSCVKPIAKLMEELVQLTNAVNTARASITPTKPPISFTSKDLIGTPDVPELEYVIRLAINTNQFTDNLIDPSNA